MLGFVALDHRPGDDTVALWLISRTDPAEASSTNAVVVDLAAPDALSKIHALTRDRVVVLTPDSDAAGLPVDPHDVGIVDEFIAATRAHQAAIVDAIRAHQATRKGQKLAEPTFPAEAEAPQEWPTAPELRALQLARWLGRTWTNWLVSDGERLRRTTQPRTGRTPWIMPEELNQPQLLELPPALDDVWRVEPLTPAPR